MRLSGKDARPPQQMDQALQRLFYLFGERWKPGRGIPLAWIPAHLQRHVLHQRVAGLPTMVEFARRLSYGGNHGFDPLCPLCGKHVEDEQVFGCSKFVQRSRNLLTMVSKAISFCPAAYSVSTRQHSVGQLSLVSLLSFEPFLTAPRAWAARAARPAQAWAPRSPAACALRERVEALYRTELGTAPPVRHFASTLIRFVNNTYGYPCPGSSLSAVAARCLLGLSLV